MQESVRGRPIKKDLYPSVLRLGRFGVRGIFNTLYGCPKPRPDGPVARVGVAAQPDSLFCTLDIRQCFLSTLWRLDQATFDSQRKV